MAAIAGRSEHSDYEARSWRRAEAGAGVETRRLGHTWHSAARGQASAPPVAGMSTSGLSEGRTSGPRTSEQCPFQHAAPVSSRCPGQIPGCRPERSATHYSNIWRRDIIAGCL